MIAASTPKMIIHISMLKEDIDPSARPIKKKMIAMAQIKTSIPKNILNNRNFMNCPFLGI